MLIHYLYRVSLFCVFVLRKGLTQSPRLEWSCGIMAHYSLNLQGSGDPPTSASQVARTTGMYHHTQLNKGGIVLSPGHTSEPPEELWKTPTPRLPSRSESLQTVPGMLFID